MLPTLQLGREFVPLLDPRRGNILCCRFAMATRQDLLSAMFGSVSFRLQPAQFRLPLGKLSLQTLDVGCQRRFVGLIRKSRFQLANHS